MKISIILAGLIAIALIQSCQNKEDKYAFLNAQSKDSLIIGTYLLNAGDTLYIRQIFDNPYMRGITHWREHYGKSIYVARMEMLQKISKLNPPNAITDTPDTAVIEFYKTWAKESGYLK